MMLNNGILTSMKNIASKKVHLLEGVIAIIKERKKTQKTQNSLDLAFNQTITEIRQLTNSQLNYHLFALQAP